MHFAFTEDQDDLRAAVRSFLEHRGALAQAHAAADGDTSDGPATWAQLIEQMELTSLAVGEEHGGTGASFVEVGIVLEELGRALLPSPYLATVVAAEVVQRVAEPALAAELLPRIVAGAVATVAFPSEPGDLPEAHASGAGHALTGTCEQVLEGASADLLLVPARDGDAVALFAVEPGTGVTIEPLPVLDRTRPQARLVLREAPARRLAAPGDDDALALARDLLSVALAAESVGAAARCLDVTVAYLLEREQFGRRLGTFQALRHRCADVAAQLEAATSAAYAATWTAAYDPGELGVLAPIAEAVGTEAFLHAAGESIQLHGGIGFTWEHEAHLYFKRAKSTELLFGGPRTLRRLAAERAGAI